MTSVTSAGYLHYSESMNRSDFLNKFCKIDNFIDLNQIFKPSASTKRYVSAVLLEIRSGLKTATQIRVALKEKNLKDNAKINHCITTLRKKRIIMLFNAHSNYYTINKDVSIIEMN